MNAGSWLKPIAGFALFLSLTSNLFGQDIIWHSMLSGEGYDEAYDVAIGPMGEVYIAGAFNGDIQAGIKSYVSKSKERDLYFAKFSSDGELVWFKGTGGIKSDACNAITCDPEGNIYITGLFYGRLDFDFSDESGGFLNASKGDGQDLFIAKYNSEGNHIWSRSIGTYSLQEGIDLKVDKDQNVYLLGQLSNNSIEFDTKEGLKYISPNGQDILVAKMNKAGDFVWVRQIGGAGIETGRSLVVDNNGNTTVCGEFHQTLTIGENDNKKDFKCLGYSSDAFVVQYDKNGRLLWNKVLHGKRGLSLMDMALGDSNEVYLTGYFKDSLFIDNSAFASSDEALYISKIDRKGNLTWLKHANKGSSRGNSICYDGANIYVAGLMDGSICMGALTDEQCITYDCECIHGTGIVLKYDLQGNAISIRMIGSKREQYRLQKIAQQENYLLLTGWLNGDIPSISKGVTTNHTKGADVPVIKIMK